MSKYKKGDLVWVPSNITLLQLDEKENTVLDWIKTSKPNNMLVINEKSGPYYHVLFRGQKWSARENDMYEVTEEDKEDIIAG
jgi:hypothetical protein